jgi:hypothetical protein
MNRIDTRLILGKERFKSSINTDFNLNVPLSNTQKEMEEYDRNVVLSLVDVFEEERQSSSVFRFTTNLDFLFFNSYVGTSQYDKFTNQLYYISPEDSFSTGIWSGYPQYKEFDFMRVDNNVEGYTKDPSPHIKFINEESSFYNWNFYLSYPFENDFNRILLYYPSNGVSQTWVASDGIPFKIIKPFNFNGQNLISLECPVPHNFQSGQFVEITYNGKKYIEEVFSLGNNGYNSENFIININLVSLGSKLPNGGVGTLKRIVDINNTGDSKSIYYVRKHKILTKSKDAILTKSGFEQNGFGTKFRFQFDKITPIGSARITQRHGNQSYNLTFKRDIDILPLTDNLKRPITEIFVTIINKGYFGWFNKPISNNVGVREGFGFNITNTNSPYWSNSNNSINLTNLQLGNYTSNGRVFYFNRDLSLGDIINGDFCEFNQVEQREYVLSDIYHKIYFNNEHFTINDLNNSNPFGYYYKPHHSIKIRAYSDYLEEASVDNIVDAPDYAYYIKSSNKLIWRDIYSYGYIDEKGLGFNYPFINGTHYPYSKIIFRLKPEGSVKQSINEIANPIIDECE